MPLRPKDLDRAAEHVLRTVIGSENAKVAVLWQRSGETSAVFAERAATARERINRNQMLIVVCDFGVVKRSNGVIPVEIPAVMLGLFDKPARYRVCFGGRGAGRSWSFARALLVRALQAKIRLLCAREFQNSIADSVHTLLSDQIETLGLGNFFEIQATAIYARGGSEFIFSGIKSNVQKIKSLEGCSIAFVEEAALISDPSWSVLIPTIRTIGSEIWAAFNPDQESDPTYERFVTNPPDNAIVLKTTFADNPRFRAPLQQEMEYLRKVDDDAYRHVWLGECRQHSDAQIFKNKYSIESFEPQPHWAGPYHGLDLGFSADPSVLTKCWVADNKLYVQKEAWQLHCDIDKLPALLNQINDSNKHTIRVDNSRPETVSYLQQHGFPNTVSVDKWPGSVEDGVSRMRAFEQIVIHPSCVHTIDEFRLYSYKTDRLTGDVLPEIIDKNNHAIDSIRYGIAPLIKTSGAGAFLAYMATQAKVDTQAKAALTKRPGVVVTEMTGAWHRE